MFTNYKYVAVKLKGFVLRKYVFWKNNKLQMTDFLVNKNLDISIVSLLKFFHLTDRGRKRGKVY